MFGLFKKKYKLEYRGLWPNLSLIELADAYVLLGDDDEELARFKSLDRAERWLQKHYGLSVKEVRI